MPLGSPTLHLLCGKAASGKSTLAAELGEAPGTVVISEDQWLAALYGDQMSTLADYVRCSGKLEGIIAPHAAALLKAGVSVVLDFHANTRARRAWMRGIIEQSGADHRLHYLDVPDEVCLERLRARNASGTHPFAVTEEQFARISKHFEAPSPEEGFNVEVR
ncbi:MAG: ATP-binding protein [Rhodobacteraceae bacterium]|nr:ATP-binding protein [Paracoccaceae bacterium]